MKIFNYKNPHASKHKPLVSSWDLMYLVKQMESKKDECQKVNKRIDSTKPE